MDKFYLTYYQYTFFIIYHSYRSGFAFLFSLFINVIIVCQCFRCEHTFYCDSLKKKYMHNIWRKNQQNNQPHESYQLLREVRKIVYVESNWHLQRSCCQQFSRQCCGKWLWHRSDGKTWILTEWFLVFNVGKSVTSRQLNVPILDMRQNIWKYLFYILIFIKICQEGFFVFISLQPKSKG